MDLTTLIPLNCGGLGSLSTIFIRLIIDGVDTLDSTAIVPWDTRNDPINGIIANFRLYL